VSLEGVQIAVPLLPRSTPAVHPREPNLDIKTPTIVLPAWWPSCPLRTPVCHRTDRTGHDTLLYSPVIVVVGRGVPGVKTSLSRLAHAAGLAVQECLASRPPATG
jgi:hypothetical protein